MNMTRLVMCPVFFVSLGMAVDASANVFGSLPSEAAGKRVKTCNAHLETFRALRGLAEALEAAEGSDQQSDVLDRARALIHDPRFESFEAVVGLRTTLSDSGATPGQQRDDLAKGMRTAQRAAARRFGEAACPAIYSKSDVLEQRPENGEYTDTLNVGLEPAFRFHIGGAAAVSDDADQSFAPALGVGYASNSAALTLLIDPRITQADAARLAGSDAFRDLGRQVLSPQLAAQSVYFSWAWFLCRGFWTVHGPLVRVVGRRTALAFTGEEPGADARTVDAFFLAPTIGYTFVSDGIQLGGSSFHLGAQIGGTARLAIFEDGVDKNQRASVHKSWADGPEWGLGAVGLDLTFFLSFSEVQPFARMTLLDGGDHLPESLTGFSMVFGLDVLASLKFEQDG